MAQTPAQIFDLKGIPVKKDAFLIIVKTAWNFENVDRLLQGCIEVLQEHQINFEVIEVPGAVEIPFCIQYHARHANCKADAYIALGCVIQGGTPHFEYVCRSVTDGITQLNLQLDAPVIYGVLTLLNQQQAEERLGGVHGHKGREAAATALHMLSLKQQIQTNSPS